LATLCLFRRDAYLTEAAATVLEVHDRGGIILDKTVFYVTGGGQPGDTGILKRSEGTPVEISTAVYGDGDQIIHVPAEGARSLQQSESVVASIDWQRRYRHMRLHTGLHLLTVVLPFPVTGGRIGTEEAHLDFDIEGPLPTKDEVQYRLNELLAQDRSVSSEWITDEELLANPGLIKTRAVKPPIGTGRVRLIRIGDIDLQPCGGTHVRLTSEIGQLTVTKIENKGRQNRRVRIRLFDL
jgi:misacylated tRNA(Ala) deacylase